MVRCLFLYFLFISSFAFGQKMESAIWLYGPYSKFNFTHQPVQITLSQDIIGANYGVATICDSLGKLQFYTAGDRIIDRIDSTIVNFDNDVTQYESGDWGGHIIVPFADTPGVYHYFSVRDRPAVIPTYRLHRFIVDMRLNNGFGAFVDSRTKIIRDSVETQLACMLHANGKDTWLIGRRWHTDSLAAWFVRDTGISQPVFQQVR